MGAEAGGIRLTRHASGARVVTETLPELRSVAIGFWIGTGARDEDDERSGASHFLEHLLFKGTPSRTAPEIAEAIESVGGDMNAFTSHECTAFYVRVPDDRLPLAIEILSDVIWSPTLDAGDMDAERQVILEEIRMRDDAPDEVLHDLLSGALFPDHPLGRSVLGGHESIGAMTRDQVADYHASHYHPSNVVVAAAGNLDHDVVVNLVEQGLERGAGVRPKRPMPAFTVPVEHTVLRRDTEQAHVGMAVRGLARDDDDRYAFTVLNQVLGGGMSSRLFQEVRERRGLAYSVYSYRAAYEDTGSLALYAGTTPARVDETIEVLHAELDRIVSDRGVTDRELEAARGHLIGSMALGLETSASRMQRLGRSELTLGAVPSLDELAAAVEAVTPDDIARVVDRVLVDVPRTLTVVGPFDPDRFDESHPLA
ncbi:MAG TPA: pitrilysin family protein [Acidimicrobiia bacterium]|nr:pitrilysin family protein [Acidimicrobiia bacterium]